MIVIARGRISGTYADSFHRLNDKGQLLDTSGKVREPYEGELNRIRADLKRHLDSVRREFRELKRAQKLLAEKI